MSRGNSVVHINTVKGAKIPVQCKWSTLNIQRKICRNNESIVLTASGAQKAGNSDDVEDRQGVSSFSSGISLSASLPRKMTEKQVIDCPVDHALPQDCDTMDTTDSFPCDSELPTFDLVSSLGILL